MIGCLENNKIMNVEDREDDTYHETCHDIIGGSLKHANQLFKVIFIPRSSDVFGYAQGSKVQDFN